MMFQLQHNVYERVLLFVYKLCIVVFYFEVFEAVLVELHLWEVSVEAHKFFYKAVSTEKGALFHENCAQYLI